jgi:hypothetical protein
MSIHELANRQRRRHEEAALLDHTLESLNDLLEVFFKEALPQVRDSLDDSTELGQIGLTWQIPGAVHASVLDRDRPHLAAIRGRRHAAMIRVPAVSNTDLTIWPFNWIWFRENGRPEVCLPQVRTGFRCETTDATLHLLCDASLVKGTRIWSRKERIEVRRWFCTWRGHEENHKIVSWLQAWLAGKRLRSEFRPKRLY